jgi:hypothetical protein
LVQLVPSLASLQTDVLTLGWQLWQAALGFALPLA